MNITDFIGGGWKKEMDNNIQKRGFDIDYFTPLKTERNLTEEELDELNYVTCMRCGLVEEGEERSVGGTDETYYLCENCDGEMNG